MAMHVRTTFDCIVINNFPGYIQFSLMRCSGIERSSAAHTCGLMSLLHYNQFLLLLVLVAVAGAEGIKRDFLFSFKSILQSIQCASASASYSIIII